MYTSEQEIERLLLVSRLYYEENLSQYEIAREINVSRPLVSKLLAKAKKLGIVTVIIRSPLKNNEYAAKALCETFGLAGAVVVPRTAGEDGELNIVAQAMRLAEEPLKKAAVIGLGWGSLVDRFAREFPEGARERRGRAVPLIGTSNVSNRGYNPNEIVRLFCERTGDEPCGLFAPAFPGSMADRELFAATQNFRDAHSLWNGLDVAVVRVSGYPTMPDQATAARFGKVLSQKRAVGAVVSRFYDVQGRFISGENDWCIGIAPDQLRRARCVLGLCSGNLPASAALGALRSGLFTHMVLDETVAGQVMTLWEQLSKEEAAGRRG